MHFSNFLVQFSFHGIIEQPRLQETSKDHLVQPLVGKGSQMRQSSRTLSSRIWKTSSDGDPTMCLGRLFEWMIVLTVRISFLYWDKTAHGGTCTHCPLSPQCGSLWGEALTRSISCYLEQGHFPQLWFTVLWSLAASSERKVLQSLSSSLCLSFGKGQLAPAVMF